MHRPAPRRGNHTKIVKTCDKTGGICVRIGRTLKGTAAIFGTTTETCKQTVRICGKTRGPFVMTGNNCSMMNMLGRTPATSNRTGRMSVTTVKTSKAIVGMSEPITKAGKETVTVSGQIDGACLRIGRT